MTIAREKRALARILEQAKTHLATATAAVEVNASPPWLWLRTLAETYVADVERVIQQHQDLTEPDEKTPPMSTSASQQLRATSKADR